MIAHPTLTFPLGELVRFDIVYSRTVDQADIDAGLAVAVQRAGVYLTAVPVAGDFVLTDPGALELRLRDPAAVESAFVYLTNSELTRLDVGIYRADVPGTAAASAAGEWQFRWQAGVGAGIHATEGRYRVASSSFTP